MSKRRVRVELRPRPGENPEKSFRQMLAVFRRKVDESGIKKRLREVSYYESESQKRRRKRRESERERFRRRLNDHFPGM